MDTIEEPVTLSVKKLAKDFSFTKYPIWGGLEDVISIREVKERLAAGRSEGPLPKVPNKGFPYDAETDYEFRKYHVGRIAYLVKHPATDPISIDVGIPSLGMTVAWQIDDGNHRLSAAIVRGDKTILAVFSGEEKEIKRFIKRYGHSGK